MLEHLTGLFLSSRTSQALVLGFVLLSTATIGARQLSARDEVPSQESSANTNEIFAEIGRGVPDFGGMFLDEQQSDTLDVYVLKPDPGAVSRLDQAIRDVMGPDRPPYAQIRLLQGTYTFVQLKQWHDRLSPAVLAIPGTVLAAIDQGANCLLVGIETLALETEVAATLAELGIPREAVHVVEMAPIEEIPPAVASPENPSTLHSRIRPLVGGIQIVSNARSLCTLGFIAQRDNATGLVTNSHCTAVRGGVDNTIFYQPSRDDANRVGVETVDPCYTIIAGEMPSFPNGCMPIPPVLSNEDKTRCGEKQPCRYSDSAFAALDNGVTSSLGFIARPVSEGTLRWDPPDTFFKIVGEQNIMVRNQYVSRIGSQTGLRGQVVVLVCSDENVTAGGTTYRYICQNIISGGTEAGDSGGPVFRCFNSSNPDQNIECPGPRPEKIVNVRFVGMLWGVQSGSTRFTVYSPIGSMTDNTVRGIQHRHELGPLRKCAENGC